MIDNVVHLCAPAVILGIDQGATSGYSIWVRGSVVQYGAVRKADQRRWVVDKALYFEAKHDLPLIVVVEDHTDIPAGKSRNARQLLGMGVAKGRWLEALDLVQHPRSRVTAVKASQWRHDVLSVPKRSGLRTEALKQLAVAYCRRFTPAKVDHDTAEALCIGFWATRAPVVKAMVPLTWRRRAAHG